MDEHSPADLSQRPDLSRCPFCDATYAPDGNFQFRHEPDCFLMTMMRPGFTREQVIAAWNQRPEEKRLQQIIIEANEQALRAMPADLTFADLNQALRCVADEMMALRKHIGMSGPFSLDYWLAHTENDNHGSKA